MESTSCEAFAPSILNAQRLLSTEVKRRPELAHHFVVNNSREPSNTDLLFVNAIQFSMSIPHQFVEDFDSLLQPCYIRLYSLQVPSLPSLFSVFPLYLQGFCTSRSGSEVSVKVSRRRPTFPHSCPCSIIGAEGLNCRVRNGNGCLPLAKVTVKGSGCLSAEYS